MRIIRITLLLTVFVSASISISGVEAKPVNFAANTPTLSGTLPLVVAQEFGFFAAEGLEVKTVFIRGGPTAMATARFNLEIQYWSSRGFAVVDVNYGGSTGYGREYRRRLRGGWGISTVPNIIFGDVQTGFSQSTPLTASQDRGLTFVGTLSNPWPTGVLQLVGVNPKGSRLPLDLFDVHHREITIHGAFGRGRSFRRALALMPTLRVKSLVTARFPLSKVEDAFAHATAGRGVKTIVTPAAG